MDSIIEFFKSKENLAWIIGVILLVTFIRFIGPKLFFYERMDDSTVSAFGKNQYEDGSWNWRRTHFYWMTAVGGILTLLILDALGLVDFAEVMKVVMDIAQKLL